MTTIDNDVSGSSIRKTVIRRGPVWFAATSILLFCLYFFFSGKVDPNHFPDFVVLSSVIFTSFYAYIFIVVPQFGASRGVLEGGVWWLGFWLLLSVLSSIILFSVYVDKTFFHVTSIDKLYVVRVLDQLASPIKVEWFQDFIHSSIRIFVEWHFAVFVVVFTAVDWIFSRHAPLGDDRNVFRRLLLIVDGPVVIAVFLTLFAGRALSNHDREIFISGAISFQLISGNAAAYILENYFHLDQKLRWRAIGTEPSAITSAGDSSAGVASATLEPERPQAKPSEQAGTQQMKKESPPEIGGRAL